MRHGSVRVVTGASRRLLSPHIAAGDRVFRGGYLYLIEGMAKGLWKTAVTALAWCDGRGAQACGRNSIEYATVAWGRWGRRNAKCADG